MKMELQPWVFPVSVHPGESLGHFLGRFRRANSLSRQGLAELLGISVVITRAWETPSRQQLPTPTQLARLSELVGIPSEQLTQMLPPKPSQIYLRTRLCGACYAEVPSHQNAWQQAGVEQCHRHQLPLLTACSACGTAFRPPALWENGCCECCWLPFSQMRAKLSC